MRQTTIARNRAWTWPRSPLSPLRPSFPWTAHVKEREFSRETSVFASRRWVQTRSRGRKNRMMMMMKMMKVHHHPQNKKKYIYTFKRTTIFAIGIALVAALLEDFDDTAEEAFRRAKTPLAFKANITLVGFKFRKSSRVFYLVSINYLKMRLCFSVIFSHLFSARFLGCSISIILILGPRKKDLPPTRRKKRKSSLLSLCFFACFFLLSFFFSKKKKKKIMRP